MISKILYTVEEAMDAVAISRTGLYKAIANNELVSMKIGRKRRFTAKALAEYVSLLERGTSVRKPW